MIAMSSESDRLLIQNIRRGDKGAWEQLIARYEGRLLAFARQRLHDKSLSTWERRKIVDTAVLFSADGYNWGDILLQGMDALARTTWFTDHLSIGLADEPICSYVVAAAYRAVNLSFGRVRTESVRPSDIYLFAQMHPELYSIGQVK